MSSICIIPARGGSKRIPKKNIKLFRGKPLIQWTIEAAIESDSFDKIIVSTDDNNIARIAEGCGASVPFMRSESLSGDYANVVDVIKEVINNLIEKNYSPEFVCCIYPTAILVSSSDLSKSFKKIKSNPIDRILFAATTYDYPVQRALILDENNNSSMLNEKFLYSRSQDLVQTYHDAGQFYWGIVNTWLKTSNILDGGNAFIVPRWRVQDIDEEEDWNRAEIMHKIIKDKHTD